MTVSAQIPMRNYDAERDARNREQRLRAKLQRLATMRDRYGTTDGNHLRIKMYVSPWKLEADGSLSRFITQVGE